MDRHFDSRELAVSRVEAGQTDAPRHAAAAKLKNEVLQRVEAHWLGIWNAGLLELVARRDRPICTSGIAKRNASKRLSISRISKKKPSACSNRTGRFSRETAERFDEILMDELQDTNRLQWSLINLIRRRLFAVGDINQSIYGFRHADPAVFHEYRATLEQAPIDELRENHRS